MILAAIGLFHLANGLFMAADPGGWYFATPEFRKRDRRGLLLHRGHRTRLFNQRRRPRFIFALDALCRLRPGGGDMAALHTRFFTSLSGCCMAFLLTEAGRRRRARRHCRRVAWR